MRPVTLASAMTLLIGGFLATPSFANIGNVMLSISSTDDNGPLDDNPALGVINYFGGVPATVPISVGFSATTSGVDGANNGVQGVALDVTGSAIAGIMQTALTPDTTFTNLAFFGGLGFDLLPDGTTGAVGIIAGIGNAQALPGGWNPATDADNVGHAGNVTVASGFAATGGQIGSVDIAGNANLWTIGHAASVPANAIIPASLNITNIVPEPASLLLLAPAAVAFLRRRRAA